MCSQIRYHLLFIPESKFDPSRSMGRIGQCYIGKHRQIQYNPALRHAWQTPRWVLAIGTTFLGRPSNFTIIYWLLPLTLNNSSPIFSRLKLSRYHWSKITNICWSIRTFVKLYICWVELDKFWCLYIALFSTYVKKYKYHSQSPALMVTKKS
jgi:hypothetical protein